ncbi:Hypothetical predicted protein, partial [Paramuricea clavata]
PSILIRNEIKLTMLDQMLNQDSKHLLGRQSSFHDLLRRSAMQFQARRIAVPPLPIPVINLPKRGQYALTLTLYITQAKNLIILQETNINLGFPNRSVKNPNRNPAMIDAANVERS